MKTSRTRMHPVLDFLKFHLLIRLVSVADKGVHDKKLALCLASTTIYAIAYGIYEYFIVYKGLMGHVLDEKKNWAIMIGGLVVVVLVSTWSNVEMLVVSLLYMFLLEDLTYWTCQWIELGVYPFPAVDWFDAFFASFRVLGGIGQAIPVWPYVPFFYIPGYAMILVYYLASWRSAKAGRVVAWIIGPFFIAIIAGTLVTEEIATWLLIVIPSALTTHAVIALAVNRHDTRPRD
ncbi:MAG: hypothetical protein Q6373_023165 [Candidatus Sigynarchaeota archaeon]